MSNFEEALSNIDVFCRVLVRKIIEEEDCHSGPEPIENLLKGKYVVEAYWSHYWPKEPLVDVFEDEEQIKILTQCQQGNREVTFHHSGDFTEIWIGGDRKIRLPIERLYMNDVTVKHNNQAIEITILKRREFIDAQNKQNEQNKYSTLNVK